MLFTRWVDFRVHAKGNLKRRKNQMDSRRKATLKAIQNSLFLDTKYAPKVHFQMIKLT